MRFHSDLGYRVNFFFYFFAQLFAVCLFHLDYQWQAQNAVRGDFGKIMSKYAPLVRFSYPANITSVCSTSGTEKDYFECVEARAEVCPVPA